MVVLLHRDTVSEDDWATSVLVKDETLGFLKTKVAEHWASAKDFDARRVDRRLFARDRLDDVDPRLALSGVDKVEARRLEARRLLAEVGFDCIINAGLGRAASNFDRYRVTVFYRARLNRQALRWARGHACGTGLFDRRCLSAP